MSTRDEAVEMIRRICPPHLDRDGYGRDLDEKFAAYRTEVLREAADKFASFDLHQEADALRRMADEAQQTETESDHRHTSVMARGHMDEPLGYLICGICGKQLTQPTT